MRRPDCVPLLVVKPLWSMTATSPEAVDPRIEGERHEALPGLVSESHLQLDGVAFGDASLAVDEVGERGVRAVGDADGGVGRVVVFDDDFYVLAIKKVLHIGKSVAPNSSM